jgi:dTDP-4-dehydrorhamnose reductase
MSSAAIKTVVIGANGQLGTDCLATFQKAGHDVVGLTHQDIELAEEQSVRAVLSPLTADLVINTAAMHNVEACERSPLQAFAINGLGARNLALLANELNFTLVQISTDYVFDGLKDSPYREADIARPLNAYGNSKLTGELFVQTIAHKYFVVRVSAIYGMNPCRAKGGNNFVKLMLKLGRERGEVRVVDDEFVSPTYTPDIANQLLALSQTDAYGVIHATSNGSCSWYEFASEIFKLAGTSVKLDRAAAGEFPMKVPRPKYSVLENSRLQALGLDRMPEWRDAVGRYLVALSS